MLARRSGLTSSSCQQGLQLLPAGAAKHRPWRQAVVQARRPAARAQLCVRASSLHCSSSDVGEPSTSAAPQTHIQGLASNPQPMVPAAQQQQQQRGDVRASSVPEAAAGGGGSGGSSDGGGAGGGGGGGGGGDSGKGGDGEEDDRLLDLAQAEAMAAAARVRLPADMAETARTVGLRSTALSKYISLQALVFVGGLVQRFSWVRDRMIFDDKYLFKVLAECVIDCGCATVAEVRKRGDEFWKEFEFYLSDMLVGITLDVVLVTLICPKAVIGGKATAAAGQGALQKWLATVPAAALEANVKGVRSYSLGQRLACLGVKFLEYSLAGIVCGFIGQGIANSAMAVKRQMHGASEDDVAVPPLLKTALVWGLFMGVSSNLRYQAVFGLERLVDSTIAAKVPSIAYGTTIAIRFVNNVIGGEQFIDLARWAGVQ